MLKKTKKKLHCQYPYAIFLYRKEGKKSIFLEVICDNISNLNKILKRICLNFCIMQ